MYALLRVCEIFRIDPRSCAGAGIDDTPPGELAIMLGYLKVRDAEAGRAAQAGAAE